ncbi:isochorismatase family protein [Paraburkholderia sp. BR10923]|uniref:isochorismatase family protein n=1 Tax=Paraburkholderia sp. BR10923 TaxID=3236992 RepID=UPI0034CD072F
MSRIAVIVIDVQQMFFSGPAAAYRAGDVIDGINRVTQAARRENAPVFSCSTRVMRTGHWRTAATHGNYLPGWFAGRMTATVLLGRLPSN